MELVDGPTLADRLKAGPLALEEALKIASQVADALEAAHEKGVVHRDLKPANIKAPIDAPVKVLDFGLATALQVGAREPADGSLSPTLTMGGTEAGVILGTAAYMSPEQASGRPVDKRADIWSFGAVLFEMLAGQRLFEGGETVSHTLADVLRAPIDFRRLPPTTPRTIVDLIKRCLDRDVKTRLRDIGEARVAIAKYIVDPMPEPEPVEVAVRAASRPYIWIAATAVLVLASVGLALGWYRASRPGLKPLMRFNDDLGVDLYLDNANGPAVAISPDGSRLAFLSFIDGKRQISVRLVGSSKSNVLANTEDAAAPFFSPDGRWIGFFASSKLKKISVEGGSAVNLCDVMNPRVGYWGEDGNILFANQRSPLMRVSSSGGMPVPATTLDQQKQEVTNRYAQVLPGGEVFLYSASADNNVWEDATVQAQEMKTGKRKTLVEHASFGRYLTASNGSSFLLYMQNGTIFAAPMNLKRLELTGPAFPVLDDVSSREIGGYAQLDATASGTLVYVSGSGRRGQQALAWFSRDGTTETLTRSPSVVGGLRVSPDGSRIAVAVQEKPGVNLGVFEWAANRTTELTFLKGPLGSGVAWAPDGKHIAFSLITNELAGPGIYWVRADGAGEPQRLLEGGGEKQNASSYVVGSFSPDGRRLAFTDGNEILMLPLELVDPERPKPGKPELFLKENARLQDAKFSPDGRWISYGMIEAGTQRPDIFVRPFPANASGGRWKISTVAGNGAIWSQASHELIFASPQQTMSVSYTVKGDAFVPSPPQPWPDKAHQMPSSRADLMPDGKRAIYITTGSDTTTAHLTHVTFLLNFADELARRAEGSR